MGSVMCMHVYQTVLDKCLFAYIYIYIYIYILYNYACNHIRFWVLPYTLLGFTLLSPWCTTESLNDQWRNTPVFGDA